MIISLDTECTGLDFAHGAMPFLVTTCANDGTIRFWEWDVDPLTRKPDIPSEDISDIAELIDAADLIYFQNSKYDIRALLSIGLQVPWDKVRDTLVMGHLLASNHRHNLTDMCLEYLGVDIEPFELKVKEITQAARSIAKSDYPTWLIAKEGANGMPSVKESSKRDGDKPWKNDMWLPRAYIRLTDWKVTNPDWLDACSKYANADSEYTLYLGLEMEKYIAQRGLWKIYEHRINLPRIASEMECYGLTAIGDYTESTIQQYSEYSAESEAELVSIAAEYGHHLELADGPATNDNMRDFFYGSVTQSCTYCNYTKRIKHWNGEEANGEVCPKCLSRKKGSSRRRLGTTRRDNLKLPIIYGSKTGNASLDKDAMQEYLTTLDGQAPDFVRLLTDKRKHETDLSYMKAYQRFWVPVVGSPGHYRIHASLNPCATDHLRWASNNPNLQNVGKQEDEWRLSVRNCFGPAPGREWWSMDFQNIELRIPGYESGEKSMVEVFEKPNEPPYWGSYHNLIASIVYSIEYFERDLHLTRDGFKKKYKATLYQWIKNFNFAKQYGCGKRKGDATARKAGAFDLVDQGLPKLASLQAYYLLKAEKTGYVETLPDRTVDSQRGYPILASRTEDNRILSTTPFNYHVSGTACWCKNQALIRCSDRLRQWRESEDFDGHIALEIHDEIIFDFPGGDGPGKNMDRALVLKGLMEQSGEDLLPRIPTPVSVEYHSRTWAEGVGV